MTTSDSALKDICDGAVDLHVESELAELLRSGRELRIKAGFDPTRPDLHLGHTVLLRKLQTFQRLGHRVVFIVGDVTARIGDPTGRNTTRPALTHGEIQEAAATYQRQALKLLDPERTEVRYNSEWLDNLRLDELIQLTAKYTLARMLEREDFKMRYESHAPLGLHELLYPLVQAYDSVCVGADVELGGSDQLFNLLVGREIMRDYGRKPQVVLTLPIMEGLAAREVDGQLQGEKMSKSLNNYVAVEEAAAQQLGKLMSISDDLMWRYSELLSDLTMGEQKRRRDACAAGELNPRDVKLDLAEELVTRFHGSQEAAQAREQWLAQFSRRQVPVDMPSWTHIGAITVVDALVESGALESKSDARRRIRQGAVRVDEARLSDVGSALLPRDQPYIIKAGKQVWVEIRVNPGAVNPDTKG